MSDVEEYGYTLPGDRKAENEIVLVLDEAGYVCAPLLIVSASFEHLTGWQKTVAEAAKAIALPAYQAMRDLPNPPLDPADIDWPHPAWPVDEDGRLLSILEVARYCGITKRIEQIRLAEITERLTLLQQEKAA